MTAKFAKIMKMIALYFSLQGLAPAKQNALANEILIQN